MIITCHECKNMFITNQPHSKFCGKECRKKSHRKRPGYKTAKAKRQLRRREDPIWLEKHNEYKKQNYLRKKAVLQIVKELNLIPEGAFK